MSSFRAALLTLGLLTAASAQDPVKFTVPGVSTPASQPAAAPAPATTPAASAAKPVTKFTATQVAEAYGWIAGNQLGLRQLEFTKTEIEAMARGMIAMAAGGEPPFDAAAIEPELKEFIGKKAQAFEVKRTAFMNNLRMQNLAEGGAFFTKLKENKNVVELPSGLRYEILKPGTGAVAKLGQLVTIHFTGTLVSGEAFGSSLESKQPIELPMVAATPDNPDGTLPGIVEGLTKVGVGGKAKLYIPPSLAYGDSGNQGIPPGATLIFEVEVIGVKDAPKTPAAK